MTSPAGKTIYVEEAVREHPRVAAIIKHFSSPATKPCVIFCDSYQEIFNPKRNNFALQKEHPALIIARKHSGHVQPSPYGLGGKHNFYFSHMLNCIYDCSYCFLQGLYSSAHHVLFINYEDFFAAIAKQIEQLNNEECYFFSGYDCDSLAYEPVSNFTENALPFFSQHPNAYLELRTKSLQIKPLLKSKVVNNCIVAFSLSPAGIAEEYESGVPSPTKRIAAMQQLAEQGWMIGARLDPLMWHDKWQDSYSQLIDAIAKAVPPQQMHSITLGTLRFPRSMVNAVKERHPTAKFLVEGMIASDKALSAQPQIHKELMGFCQDKLERHYPSHKIIPNEVGSVL
ncbi:MAG: DNA photolyase [Candidatus Portiera sp.]|nr:DNA photolyase [Portiera sp.]